MFGHKFFSNLTQFNGDQTKREWIRTRQEVAFRKRVVCSQSRHSHLMKNFSERKLNFSRIILTLSSSLPYTVSVGLGLPNLREPTSSYAEFLAEVLDDAVGNLGGTFATNHETFRVGNFGGTFNTNRN